MDLHPDFKDLLAEFARSKVSYALLGGTSALAAFGAPAQVVHSVRTLGVTEIAYLGAPPVRVDLLRAADGIETESVISRAEQAVIDGVPISIISLDDLLANKRAAGRTQDWADVEALERVRRGR